MGLSHSPKVVTSGLVFALDADNYKSYKGPAIQNVAPTIVGSTASGTGYSISNATETYNISGLGRTSVVTTTIQNNYTSYTPNSNQCCPILASWANITVLPSTLYTYGIVYRCDSGYTSANYMYRYEYTGPGGTYVTEAGVHSESRRVALGDGWYYAWGTFTTQATTNWLATCGAFYYRYSQTSDRLSIAKVMIVQGDYSEMHPKYWPAQASTRSNTQALLDMTNQSTITAASLTYASNGAFSFVGGTQRMDISNTIGPISNNFTIAAWINSTDITSTQNILSMNGPYFMRISGSKVRFNVLAGGVWLFQNGTTTLSSNTWYNLAMVYNYDTSLWIGYINGVQEFSVAKSGTVANSTFYGYVGYTPEGGEQSNFFGQIAAVQYYNRALTATEIKQNFIALRGRYGV